MKGYRDYYGGEVLNYEDIDGCTTKDQLKAIIEKHRSHMEDMLADANSHLDHFKKSLFEEGGSNG